MPNVNVVALVDLPEPDEPDYPRSTLPGVAPFTTAKLLVLGDHKWNEVRDLGEVSMGRPDVLSGVHRGGRRAVPGEQVRPGPLRPRRRGSAAATSTPGRPARRT